MSTMTTTADASAHASAFINLTAKDWGGAQSVELEEVDRGTTVGEVVSASVRELKLPFQNFYQALFRGRELNHGDTLDEAGVVADGEIELVPEVSAGADLRSVRS